MREDVPIRRDCAPSAEAIGHLDREIERSERAGSGCGFVDGTRANPNPVEFHDSG